MIWTHKELYRLEEVARVDSAARTSPGNPCPRPGARPSPKRDPDESWDFWAERRPETGQFHPREPSRNIMLLSTDFTLAPYSSANLFERFDLGKHKLFTISSLSNLCNLQHFGFTHSTRVGLHLTSKSRSIFRDFAFFFDIRRQIKILFTEHRYFLLN